MRILQAIPAPEAPLEAMFGLRRAPRQAVAGRCPGAPTAADDRRAARPAPDRRRGACCGAWSGRCMRRLDGLLQGDYRTLFRGFGLDLADLREYQLARRRAPYRLERDGAAADAARARVPGGPRSLGLVPARLSAARWISARSGVRKRALSADFVAVLARLLTRYGNSVGAVLHARGRRRGDAGAHGRRHVLHVLDRIAAQRRNAPSDGRKVPIWASCSPMRSR